jgi:hypothetical protein
MSVEVEYLGKTTLKRMLDAAYNENDPLHKALTYGECGCARMDVEDGSRSSDEEVYVYYHPRRNETIMTTVEGDYAGWSGSSAGFEGRAELTVISYEDMVANASLAKEPVQSEPAK